jgi:DNA (cytosine-5)-methyltransferase 1
MLRNKQIPPESYKEAQADDSDVRGYREVVEAIKKGIDFISAGFPCQDESMSGDRKGIQYNESTEEAKTNSGLFVAACRTICLVRPRRALLENVAGLLSGSMGKVLGDLAEIGYDTEWNCISSAAVGAPHERERVWILANSDEAQCERGCISERIQKEYANTSYSRRGKDKPGLVRALNGIPDQMDRLAALGDTVDPAIPELIGRAIMEIEK